MSLAVEWDDITQNQLNGKLFTDRTGKEHGRLMVDNCIPITEVCSGFKIEMKAFVA